MGEADDIVKRLLHVLSERKIEAGLRRNDKWYICFDHASVHNNVASLLGRNAELWPQPAHSPDFNKPIEHVHSQVDAAVKGWLKQQRQQNPQHRITPAESMQQVEDAFYRISTTSIKADIESLPNTWQAVVANGGGYVARDLS